MPWWVHAPPADRDAIQSMVGLPDQLRPSRRFLKEDVGRGLAGVPDVCVQGRLAHPSRSSLLAEGWFGASACARTWLAASSFQTSCGDGFPNTDFLFVSLAFVWLYS